MQVFRYPARTLSGDYLRSAAGVGVGLGVLTTVPIGWAIGLIFGGLAGTFGLFGARTLERHITRVAVSDGEIARAALGTRVIPWSRLDNAKLRYYGTRRQQKNKDGFMQLTLRGAGTSMTFESNLEGFDYIVWRTAKAARANDVSLDPASAGNMLTLEIDPDDEAPPPPHIAQLHENVRSGG